MRHKLARRCMKTYASASAFFLEEVFFFFVLKSLAIAFFFAASAMVCECSPNAIDGNSSTLLRLECAGPALETRSRIFKCNRTTFWGLCKYAAAG